MIFSYVLLNISSFSIKRFDLVIIIFLNDIIIYTLAKGLSKTELGKIQIKL